MSKAEWGLKRICPHCNTRYYDMKKNPPVCPSCGGVFDPETLLKSRRGRGGDAKKAAVAPEEVIDDLPIIADDEADDAVIEDADELGEDDVEVEVEVEKEEAL